MLVLAAAPLVSAAGAQMLAPAAPVAPPSPKQPGFSARYAQARRMAATSARATGASTTPRSRVRPAVASPQTAMTTLGTPWTALGPATVNSQLYGQVTGRVSAVAIDPNDTTGNTVYVGATGGGVWKSTNAAGPLAAVTFAPLTDDLPVFSQSAESSALPSLSIGAIAVEPGAGGIVLAGTGDPNDATDSYYGEGLLRSADDGLTWTLATFADGGVYTFAGLSTAGIAWSTATSELAVAAMTSSPQAATVNAAPGTSIPGIYYSADGGVTWHMASVYDGAQAVQVPQGAGTGQIGNPATSVVWDAQRGQFFAAVRSHGYYSSADGVTWTRLAAQPGAGLATANCPVGSNGQGSATCPIFRGALAVQPATGDLYALTVDINENDQGLWQDICNAAPGGSCANPPAWASRLDGGAMEVGSGSQAIVQGGYNLSLAAAPASGGGTLLFAGTVDLYRCALESGGSSCTPRNTTNALNGCDAPAGVAPAQHAVAALEIGQTELVLTGNDGGLWRSIDGVAETGPACSASDAQHFDNLNAALGTGGSLAEVTGFAQDTTDTGAAETLIAGLGENGTAATTDATTDANSGVPWTQLSAGEGGYPQIASDDAGNGLGNGSGTWLLAIGAGVNFKSCTGVGCTAAELLPPASIGGPQVGDDAALLDAPSLLDPAEQASVLVGTCRVWRGASDGSAGWGEGNALSPAFDGSAAPCGASSAMVRSLGAGGAAASGTTQNAQSIGSTVIYAGIAGMLDGGGTIPGHLFVTRAADTASSATAWTDAAHNRVSNDTSNAGIFNSGAFDVSSIAVDPHDPSGATVYVTVEGFGVPHLYRSTDYGADWTSFNSNLPRVPANAVLVDPNDANTVYVATDDGVYATRQILTCAAQNCWNLLGTGLPNAPVTALAAAAALPTGDGRNGLLRAATYGRGLWETPLLTATTPAQPALTISPVSLTFASQAEGTQSATQTVTLTSSGNAPVVFGTASITAGFVESDTCAGKTLAVGASCRFAVSFAPQSTGALTGLLTIYANVSGGQATVNLSGTGTAPGAVVLTPGALSFAATVVNQTAAAQIITVANTGGTAVTLGTPSVSGDFADFAIAASTCGTILAAQTACSLSISFTPTASGSRSAVLSVTGSAGTQTAQLSGTGQSPATDTLAPLALSFAQQAIGSASAAQQVMLTNAGDVPLTLIAASVSAGDFTATNGCGTSLAAHASCAVSVVFVPTAVGQRTAVLTVADQFRSQTVTLSGVGVAPAGVSLSPASLSFAPTGVGLTALPQTLTLTNNGGLPLNLSRVAVSGGFVLASNSCGATLAMQASCSLVVVFAPTTAGTVSGTLTLTDDAPSGTQTALLSGTGIDFTLASDGPSSATIASGGTATFPLLANSVAGLSGVVALSCTGAPANSVCVVTPSQVNLGGATVITATVQTGVAAQTARVQEPGGPCSKLPGGPASAVLALLVLPLLARRRHALQVALPLFVCALALGIGGCGANRTIPTTGDPGSGGGSNPTPSGSYTLTISGTAAGLTHTAELNLIVQ